jgi:hypothetical protein
MAGRISNTIVRDGLVLCLDAANTKSYVSGSTTWNDLSRGGNNGTLVNTPAFDSANGGSIVFDGVNEYVSTQYFGDNPSSYTYSCWYNPLNDIYVNVLSRGRDGSGNGWSLFIGNNSGVYRAGVVTTDGATNTYLTYGVNVQYNKWVHITGQWTSGDSLKLYINGILNSSTSVSQTILRTSTDGWSINSAETTSYGASQISQVQIYNRALTATEILQNYNTTKGRYGL